MCMFINIYGFSHFSLYLKFNSQVPGITWKYFISLDEMRQGFFGFAKGPEEEKALLWPFSERCALTGSNEKPEE